MCSDKNYVLKIASKYWSVEISKQSNISGQTTDPQLQVSNSENGKKNSFPRLWNYSKPNTVNNIVYSKNYYITLHRKHPV